MVLAFVSWFRSRQCRAHGSRALGIVVVAGRENVGKEKDFQHSENHHEFHDNYGPQRASDGHISETIGIKTQYALRYVAFLCHDSANITFYFHTNAICRGLILCRYHSIWRRCARQRVVHSQEAEYTGKQRTHHYAEFGMVKQVEHMGVASGECERGDK